MLARGNQGRDTQADERDRKLWLETLGARPRGNWPPNAVPWPTSSRATRSSSATSMFSGLLRQACVTASRPTQALRVNYTALQHHLVATATRQSSRSGGQHPQPHRQFRPTLILIQNHHPAQWLQRQPPIGQSHPSLGIFQIEIRRVLRPTDLSRQGRLPAGARPQARRHRIPLPRILDLSSQFRALSPVLEIWTAAIQNASTPPPARYSAPKKRRFKPRNTREIPPPGVVISLLLRVFRAFRGCNCCFSGHWSCLVEIHPHHPFPLIPP